MPKIILPRLETWQDDVYQSVTGQLGSGKRFIVKSSRQKGKTFLLKVLLLDYVFKYPKSINCVIEPISSQCRRVFSELVESLENTGLLKSSNASDLVIKFKNGSEINFKSGESKKGVRGLTCTGLLVLDEAAYLDDDIIQIILPLVNVHKAPILVTSTPCFAEGWFYNQYIKESSNILQFDWSSDKYDFSKYISEEMIEEYRQEYTPQKFKTEILGEFISDSGFVFQNFKDCIVEPADKTPVYAGIDFGTGSSGDSTFVIFMNQYRQIIDIWSTNTLSPTEQINIIGQMINERPTLKKVLAESNSIGSVYFDAIKAILKNKQIFEKFYTSNESKKEVVEDLIIAFNKHEIGILDHPQLIKQLSYFDIQKTKTGYTYNNSNNSIHDDAVIALCLAYHCFKLGVVNVGFGFKSKHKTYRDKDDVMHRKRI